MSNEPEITKTYLMSAEPYARIYDIKDPFEQAQALANLKAAGDAIGFRTVMGMWKEYRKSKRGARIYTANVSQFDNQPLELDTGDWKADDLGVTRESDFGAQIACVHPIMPVRRLVNVDTGIEKLELAYRKGRGWRRLIADKRTLASANGIIALADNGVAVTSESAKALVAYLHDVEHYNYEFLEEVPSVGRLGYIDGEGFSPYVDGLVFDGDANFRTIFRSVRAEGDRQKWLETIRRVRSDSVTAHIIVAAAFASVLVQPLGALPFFVHLWGTKSSLGKTVALMAAASVWADPERGRYCQTFNSTVVGHELFAAFLNSLPLIVDEMQLARDEKGRTKFNVYQLAEGVGRTRGNKSGGVQKTPTWGNCIITCGETPLTGDSAGAGAKNRVIEIECNSELVVRDGNATSNALRRNFGHAGREFVDRLRDAGDKPANLYKEAFRALSASDTTDKQAMSAALIVAADALAAEWIIGDTPLTVEQIASFLQTNAAVDVNERAYSFMCDWVVQNVNKLRGGRDGTENCGILETDTAYVVRTVFVKAVEDAGYSSAGLLSWLRDKELLQCSPHRPGFTVLKSLGGVKAACVAMRIPSDEVPF